MLTLTIKGQIYPAKRIEDLTTGDIDLNGRKITVLPAEKGLFRYQLELINHVYRGRAGKLIALYSDAKTKIFDIQASVANDFFKNQEKK